jgi:hypothetical protein
MNLWDVDTWRDGDEHTSGRWFAVCRWSVVLFTTMIWGQCVAAMAYGHADVVRYCE